MLLCTAAPATAAVVFDVIGPHEYNLPVDFDPFNVFVQYVTLENVDRVWDAGGDRVGVPRTQTVVGLSKYVRFWSPDWNRKIGLAYEIIVPTVGIRNNSTQTSNSGIGDPITGPAIWYKPTANSTLGLQTFVQVPVGSQDIGGGDQWKYYLSPFWDIEYGKLSYTADAGAVIFGESTRLGASQGTLWFTGQRLGYAVTEHILPFFALDYEYQASSSVNPTSYELTLGAGVMFFFYGNQSLTLRYSGGVDGKNHANTNGVFLKYVYSW